MKTYCFGIDSVIKVQRKNPVGFPLFVPLTHFAGLVVLLGFFEAFKKDLRTSPKNRMLQASESLEQDAASQTLSSYERITQSHFRSYQPFFSNPRQLSLIKVSRHNVVFCRQPFCNKSVNPWLP